MAIQNPFTGGSAGLSAVPEAYQPQALENLQQQRMAQLLMQQGMQPMAQGQMVGNHYVKASPYQNLASIANQALGMYAGYQADKGQLGLAKAIREGETAAIADYMATRQGRPAVPDQVTEMAGPYSGNVPMPTATIEGRAAVPPNPLVANANLYADPRSSTRLRDMAFAKMIADPEAFTLSEGAVRYEKGPDGTVKKVASGAEKFRAPLQIDTGTAIELRDPNNPTVVLQRIPKSQMPTAGQVYEGAEGPLLVNTRAGTATPLLVDGKPIAPKLSAEQSKDITAINQQRATINGAIADIKENKSAFSFGRGVAQNLPYGESLVGRLEKPEDTQTRAYVFNNVSSVIKERAGTAQSAQELTRLNSFLPATTDNADQIISKLDGFNKYLNDFEKGTRVSPSKKPDVPQLNSFSNEADVQKAISSGTLKKGDKVTVNGVTGTIQ
jgi:hypothetical protein